MPRLRTPRRRVRAPQGGWRSGASALSNHLRWVSMQGRALALCAGCAWLALGGAPALGADPGLWKETGRSSVPLYYYQGVTSDSMRNLYFDGIYFGLYKTDSQLNQLA